MATNQDYIQKSSDGTAVSHLEDSIIYQDNANSRIGIGTTGPLDKLHVSGSGNTAIFVSHTGATAHTAYFQAVSGQTNIGNLAGDINFQPGNSVAMTLKSGGNVGVGVTDPDRKVEIMDGGGNAQLKLSYDGTYNAQMKVDGSGDLTITPSGTKVTVAGQLKVTGGSPGASKVLTSDVNGLATWETNTPSTGGGWTEDSGTVKLTTTADVVGIGTANPAGNKLYVKANSPQNPEADGQGIRLEAGDGGSSTGDGGNIILLPGKKGGGTIDGALAVGLLHNFF